MIKLSELTVKEKQELNKKLIPIVDHNRRRFFSKDFTDQIINEFNKNYISARQTVDQHCHGQTWKFINRLSCQHPEIRKSLFSENPKKSKADVIKFLRLLKE